MNASSPTSPVMASNCDVLVIGGGPAGATAAALLAERGYAVTLLEKAHHPRFHIGESLLPANLPLLERLGVADEVKAIGMKKWGAEFVSPWHAHKQVFAFAQFASDLDRSTQLQLLRGQRLTELLKQDLATPYNVVDQVIAIYAGTSGILDDITNDEVPAFEKGLLAFVREKYPDAIESIRTSKEVTDDVEATLQKAFKEYAAAKA